MATTKSNSAPGTGGDAQAASAVAERAVRPCGGGRATLRRA